MSVILRFVMFGFFMYVFMVRFLDIKKRKMWSCFRGFNIGVVRCGIWDVG